MEDDVRTKPAEAGRPPLRILGEWRWERYFCIIAGGLCFLDAVVSNGLDLRALIRDGAFVAAMLWFLMFYASDVRYRLFQQVRND